MVERSRNQMSPKESSEAGKHCQGGKEQGLPGQGEGKWGINWRCGMIVYLKGVRNICSKCFVLRTRLFQTWALKLQTEFRVTSCIGVSQIIFSATFFKFIMEISKKPKGKLGYGISQGVIQRNTFFLYSWLDFHPFCSSTQPQSSLEIGLSELGWI